jgi:hypothetical protein
LAQPSKELPGEAPAVPLYFPDSRSGVKPSLLNVQRELKDRIKAKQGAAMTAEMLNVQGGVPGEERMAVYAGGYITRLSEALAEVYETVRHLLGKDAFVELSELYLERHPSRDYNINNIGKAFPAFIGSTRFSKELPFLPDLAALELAVAGAFHAFDRAPFDPAVLAALSEEDWEKMHVVFQPSVHVLGSEWPVLDIWNARKTPISEMNVGLVGRPQNVLVYRKGLEVYCEPIEKKQRDLVHHLLKGNPLGETCVSVAEAAQSEELPLEEWFSAWTGQGLIASVAS